MSVQRFSTAIVPAELRRDVVQEAYALHVKGSIDFPADRPIAADMALRQVADVHLALVGTSPVTIVTPPDDNGVLYLGIAIAGGGLIDARHEAREVKAGDVNVMRRERHCVTVAERASSILSIALPRHRVVPRLADRDSLLQTFSTDMPAARLLKGYAMALLEADSALTAEEEALFAGHMADLAALMLGPSRDAAEHAGRNGLRSARRDALQRDVRANLANPALSLDWLARRHGLSTSYIRSLFYDAETSFTDFVTRARLEHAAALLRDSAFDAQSIASIALMAGFGDISWFNQVFRRQFGMTPSAMRAE